MALTDSFFGYFPFTYTPGSDIAAGSNFKQIVWGRTGNDVVLSYEPIGSDVGTNRVEVLVGDFEFPQLDAQIGTRNWRDTFILGDWRTPYFSQTSSFDFGIGDFAIIPDFQIGLDKIELYGRSSDYFTIDLGFITGIFYNQPIFPQSDIALPNLIAVTLNGSFGTSLDLNSSDFVYQGYAPLPPTNRGRVKQIGTIGLDISDSISADRRGNVFVSGMTTGYLGSMPSGTNVGLRDIWIKKYSSRGSLLASLQFGTKGVDSVYDTVTDRNGDLYFVGSSTDMLGNLSPGFSGIGAVIGKVSSDLSKIEWIKSIDNGALDRIPAAGSFGISIDSDNNLCVSGVIDVQQPPDSILPLSTDNFVAKYAADGTQLFFNQYGQPDGDRFEESYNVCVDKSGNIIRSGFTNSDWLSPAATVYDGWVSKNDPNGNLLWAQPVATADYDWVWGLTADSSGNIYVSGWTLGSFAGTVNGNGSLGSFDAFIAKYDANGNRVWINQFGTAGDDQAFAVQVDSRGIPYVGGYTDSAFAGKTNLGDVDAWVASFDPLTGQQQWLTQFGSSKVDQLYDIAVSSSSIYAVGVTNGSIGTPNSGSFDTWVASLNTRSGSIQTFEPTRPSGRHLSANLPGPTPTQNGSVSISPGDVEQLQNLILSRLDSELANSFGSWRSYLPQILGNNAFGADNFIA